MISSKRIGKIDGTAMFSAGPQSSIKLEPPESSLRSGDTIWIDGEYKLGTLVYVTIEVHND